MTVGFETLEQFVQQDHLAGGSDQPVNCIQVLVVAPVLLLCSVEQEGMVAALLELDDDVQQGQLRTAALHTPHVRVNSSQTR